MLTSSVTYRDVCVRDAAICGTLTVVCFAIAGPTASIGVVVVLAIGGGALAVRLSEGFLRRLGIVNDPSEKVSPMFALGLHAVQVVGVVGLAVMSPEAGAGLAAVLCGAALLGAFGAKP